MTTLHLGVVDIPYAQAPKKLRRKAGKTPNETTGDVAEILEDKYGVMEKFFEHNEQFIADQLENSVAGALETMLMSKGQGLTDIIGAGLSRTFEEGAGEIKEKFTSFLETREVEALGIGGVPTKAALKGVNHRLKHPYASSNPRRPSFIDTSLYQQSFKCWVD